MFKVYYMNRFVKSFATRDAAVSYIWDKTQGGPAYGDYEILDKSDWL